MSVVDMVGRMTQIQSTIAQITAPAATATLGSPAPVTATTSANAATFAQALSSATAVTDPSALLPAGLVAGAGTTAAGAATGAAIAEDAKKYVGVPYVWGGTNPATGLDCSGLVQRVYKDFGIDLPRVASDQGNAGTTVPNLAAAQPGDLLVMNGGEHIGIYMGNNKYIHAPQPGMNVQIADIPAGAVFNKITRIIPAAVQSTAALPVTSSLTGIITVAQAALMNGDAA